ncbi:hypothetical protein [Symmachiella dynata]|uniref:hypothetical protein n=1 Tax=Symmachiella dynata TaxID=2527995 RepID=UPI0030EB68D3
MKVRHCCLLIMPAFLFLHPAANCAVAADEVPQPPVVESYLEKGELAEAAAALEKLIAQQPNDQQARFSLGVVQFLQAIEHLGQSYHRYGLRTSRFVAGQIPLLRLPIPKNPHPEEMTYEAGGKILETFLAKLTVAEATLAKVDTTDVKLPLHFGRIRLDLNSDGNADQDEALWKLLATVTRGGDQAAGEKFLIAFDGGDVHWLRGYCHLLSAFCDIALAYDGHELFERAGHLLISKNKTPYVYLTEDKKPQTGWINNGVFDIVAFIHLINFPVVAPDRMESALVHLEAMIEQSRQSWKRILAEKDDDREWLPNPNQSGVLPNVRVRQEMIDAWHEFLDEMELLLQGKRLIPFWRGDQESQARGVNLHRVFTEPRRFDLVLWISGTAADPYLEDGPLTDPRVWQRLMRVFRGEFFGFAIWFN